MLFSFVFSIIIAVKIRDPRAAFGEKRGSIDGRKNKKSSRDKAGRQGKGT